AGPGRGFQQPGSRVTSRASTGPYRTHRAAHRRHLLLPPSRDRRRVMARRMNVPSFVAQKGTRRLVCLTAYDVLTAGIVDEAGVDLILVGDSLGNVVLGHETTLPVTLG